MPIEESKLARSNSDAFCNLPHSEHHKYQTIQSFRPEEVKELLSQHFLESPVNGRTSAPNEEGVRRFSLVKNNFKVRRAIRNSKDAAMLRGMVDDAEVGKASSAPDSNHFLKLDPDEAQRHALNDNSDGELDAAHEIARLRAQLVHERTIYTREMARMRAQLRAFESHLAQTVARMGNLLEMVDSREHAVQELVDHNLGEKDTQEKEKEREKEKNERGENDRKVDLPTIKTFGLLT